MSIDRWDDLEELRAGVRDGRTYLRDWEVESDREDLVGLVEELALMVVEVTGVALEEIQPAARIEPEQQAELVDVALQAAIKRYTERVQ